MSNTSNGGGADSAQEKRPARLAHQGTAIVDFIEKLLDDVIDAHNQIEGTRVEGLGQYLW